MAFEIIFSLVMKKIWVSKKWNEMIEKEKSKLKRKNQQKRKQKRKKRCN
jgi:hypothetical protein